MSRNATGQMPNNGSFGGDEFSNNLFSDLAPLLTLFGEQVTKQFLSMSMGWADDILLAMGPLGIMTVIVSTIRVGRVKVLKAFVGRARESRANAEKEILSSASKDVCELWTGREVVREFGHPEGMKDLILLEKPIEVDTYSEEDKRRTQVLDIASAYSNGVLGTRFKSNRQDDFDLTSISNGAPNIALNVRNSTASPKELIAFAIVGTTLQIGGLIFPAFTTYFLKWTKGGSAIAGYGYPCFAAGTMGVIVGMIFCGRVIEGSTTEHEFNLTSYYNTTDKCRVQIMRLQRACTVSDQHFPSYAIFNPPQDIRLRTSRLKKINHRQMTIFATLTAVIGFVAQFVGLRALHWSATIFQLGIMLIMTMIRSWVRRGLAADPKFYELLDGHELSWVVLYTLCNNDNGWSEIPTPKRKSLKKSFERIFSYVVWNKPSEVAPATQPFDKMLDSIVRWEPLTGSCILKRFGSCQGYPVLERKFSRFLQVFHTSHHRSDDVGDDYNSETHTRPLDVFRDLQRLSPFTGKVIDDTNNLAMAMERAVAFLEQSDHVLWYEREGPFMHHKGVSGQIYSFAFIVDIIVGSYRSESATQLKQLELQLTGEPTDQRAGSDANEKRRHVWTADREKLAAVISMWLFALEARKSIVMELMAAIRSIEGTANFDVSRRNRFFRILGSEQIASFDSKRPNKNPLMCWIPGRIHEFPPLDGSTKSENRQSTMGSPRLLPESQWVVWGANNAGVIGAQVPGILEENQHFSYNLAIETRSDTTISQHCALELFGHFMDAVAAKIQKLGGRTRSIFNERLVDPPVERWSNSVLESIANECVMAGLAHDTAEAYTVIIPAFMKHNLLPTGPHDELEFT